MFGVAVTLRMIMYAVAVLIIAGLVWMLHHSGYVEGQADRVAYYEPMLAQSREAKAEADLRTANIEADSVRLTEQMQEKHDAQLNALSKRASDAAAHIAQLLRSSAHRTPGGGAVPEAGSAPGVPDGAPASDPRVERVANDIAAIGGRCEHDAGAVAGWQEFYERQQAIINALK